jgi:hypothetical protein
MTKPPTNLPASVRDRLLQLSRQQGEDFMLTLTRYAVERFLYRLSLSPHAEKFVLKGAALFAVWAHQPYRPTRDVDFLGKGEALQRLCELTSPRSARRTSPRTASSSLLSQFASLRYAKNRSTPANVFS